ncbi:MAG TPA: methyltransferase domain-containing protein, partial [Dehalococcoidales bacterium]|nr:methyltransferase domain-containing protein [Dehalococcoidales bacterium]
MSRQFFNDNAVGWDEKRSEKNIGKLEKMAAAITLKSGMTVLDVGSGTGVFLPYIFRMVGPGGRIIALDYAEKMLRESKNKPHPAGVCYLCGDALHLPLADNSCDAV